MWCSRATECQPAPPSDPHADHTARQHPHWGVRNGHCEPQAKVRSKKKSNFPTPPRTCTSPGGTCTRSDFLCAIVARETPRPLSRPNGMRGRPFAALRAKGPFMAALAADFPPARVANPRPTPRRLCALSRPRAPSGAERTGRNRHLRTNHVPNLAFSPIGDEKK